MLGRVESGFAEYRLDVVANALYEFTWHEFCDWYLELSKAVLQADTAGEAAKRGARFTLINSLEVLLRALHPIAPFISEEIWQRVRSSAGAGASASASAGGDTIMRCHYPSTASVRADPGAEPEMRWVMEFILGVRQIRGEMDIAPSRKLTVLLQNASPTDALYLSRNLHYVTRLAGVEVPRILGPAEAAPISAVALLGTLEILVPMAGLIDPAAELARLSRRQSKAEADLEKMESKLRNSEFAKNAPAEVVAKDQQRLAELRTEIAQLTAQIARVTRLKGQ
jgi:valyl-tRNA synthetase